MISLKGILFFGLFLFCTGGALFLPHLGIYGYIADYCIGSSRQWWEAPFSGLGIRYSYTLALATMAGVLLNRHKLQFGESLLLGQERLMLVFLGIVWLSIVLGSATVERYSTIDHPSLKFTKLVVFTLIMTHVITDRNKLNGLMWVFVLSSLALGLQAWSTPRRAFQGGRLEDIGGPDFSEANFFGAFMASMLPIIGIQFIRSRWLGKVVCALSAAFTANAIVLCRSRGAFVGIAAGAIVACLQSPRKYRTKVVALLVFGLLGSIHLVDPQFVERIGTIHRNEEQLDESAASRLRLWEAGTQMVADHPLGIGIGNWYQTIGRYIPEYTGKDSHNTYVKCAAELGVQGLLVYGFIILTSFLRLGRIRKNSLTLPDGSGDDLALFSFGIATSLAIILTCGLTITMIYTEIIWVLLMLPVCVARAHENAWLESMTAKVYDDSDDSFLYSHHLDESISITSEAIYEDSGPIRTKGGGTSIKHPGQ